MLDFGLDGQYLDESSIVVVFKPQKDFDTKINKKFFISFKKTVLLSRRDGYREVVVRRTPLELEIIDKKRSELQN